MKATYEFYNVFTAIATLKKIRNANVSEAKLEFIDTLLDKNNLKSLSQQKHTPNVLVLRHINKCLRHAIRVGGFNEEVNHALASAAKDIYQVIYHLNYLRYCEDERLIPPEEKKFLQRKQNLYIQTLTTYQSEVVLPLNQFLDLHYGVSPGYCAGYTLEWMRAISMYEKPFGIDPHNPIMHPFPDGKWTITNLSERQRQLAPINKSISLNSASQTIFSSFDNIVRSKGAGRLSHEKFDVSTYRWIYSIPSMAHYLASTVKNHPLQLFSIVLQRHHDAHIISFYRDDINCYHLLDVNYGWFRFKTPHHLEAWLAYYLNESDVMTTSTAYRVFAHAVIPVQTEKSLLDHVCKNMNDHYDEAAFQVKRYLFKWPAWVLKKINTPPKRQPARKQAAVPPSEKKRPYSPLVNALIDLPDERISHAKSALEKNPFHPGLFRRTTHDQSREPNPDTADRSAQRAFRV